MNSCPGCGKKPISLFKWIYLWKESLRRRCRLLKESLQAEDNYINCNHCRIRLKRNIYHPKILAYSLLVCLLGIVLGMNIGTIVNLYDDPLLGILSSIIMTIFFILFLIIPCSILSYFVEVYEKDNKKNHN